MTSQLVKWYNSNKSNSKLAGVILVSAERSEDKMFKYMKSKKITFPAVQFKLGQTQEVFQYFDNYLPCISIVTPQGELIEKSISMDKLAKYF